MRVLLATPPMTQLNTPYPATAYLTGFLRAHAPKRWVISQADPALQLFLGLFCRTGIEAVARALPSRLARGELAWFAQRAPAYAAAVEPAVRLLQGRDPTSAHRIAARTLLPEGPRFAPLDGDDGDGLLAHAFGELGILDRAKHLASLFVDDLADVIRLGVDPHFELSRYGERLASSMASYTPMARALAAPPTLVDDTLAALTRALITTHRPDVLGLTVPFPGNLYGALRMAQVVREVAPATRIVLGGGYVNTELRQLREPRLFDLVDYLTLDDGERPLLALLEHLARGGKGPLLRTLHRVDGVVVQTSSEALHDVPFKLAGTPTYDGLPNDAYVSMVEMLNPMHRLWSDGRWNKLTVAHGCYWKQCSFCDITLDYIGRYEPAGADLLVDRAVAMVAETGQTGFHLVDEAAPPAGLRAFAERLLARQLSLTWWGNIRFEKAFTPELASLLARAGCVAVSGGLEVASDRLLALMQKGVTVAQVARVTRALTDAGIMVHAYLMYGFPTQTEQETVDALERVRQLFAAGCIQSAYWHRFAATVHSPIGQAPASFGIRLHKGGAARFARNEVGFDDPTACDHERLGHGLRRALYNFMHGQGLDQDVRTWFIERAPGQAARARFAVPRTTVPPDLIERALAEPRTD